MKIKQLFLVIIISSFFTHAYSMDSTSLYELRRTGQENTDYQQNNAYNTSHIPNLFPEDVWLQIIACSDAKYAIRQLCSYFHELGSTKNENIFLQSPLVLAPEVLERFALYYADFENNAILNNFLSLGANPNSADDIGNSLMHFAAQNGNLEMVKTLLEHPQFDASNMATNEHSPLLLAARYKHANTVKYILSHCAIDYNAMLCLAIDYELSDFAQLLLTQIPPNTLTNPENINISQKNNEALKMNPLLYATIKRDTNLAQLLISKGVPVDARDNHHCTSFHYAIKHNATNMIKLLINNNANINHICSNRTSPLHHAAREGLTTKALFLLKQGVDINTKTASGDTALMLASMYGHTQFVKLLLAYNANVNECDNKGNAALNLAFCNWKFTIMHLLLNHPDINIKRKFYTKRLLSNVIINYRDGHKDMIDLIIEKDDINAIDDYGNNPLSYAYWEGNIEIMNKLITHPKIQINALLGQNLSLEIEENQRDCYGYRRSGPITILDLAMKHPGQKNIINLLKQYGAKTKAQLEEEEKEEELLEKI